MSNTCIKVGWARRDYGRDRYDFSLDLADLPFILAEYGVDEAGYKRMPMSRRLRILHLEAEINAKTVYYEHELADARAANPQRPVATAAMAALKAEVPRLRTTRDDLLEPYMTDEGKAALAARRDKRAQEPALA